MIRKTFFLLLSCFSLSCFAGSKCGESLPSFNPGFCPSFKSVAECHCREMGYPPLLCKDMRQIYSQMLTVYRSQQRACEHQQYTTVQVCMDDWNCYRLGNKDSQKRLCSSTGKACQ